MAKRAAGNNKVRLANTLKSMLGERASMEMLKECAPELLKALGPGKNVPTVAELLAQKVIALALDPKKSNQWAVELIFDRVEGKAVKGAEVMEAYRDVEDKLDELTTEHLNSIAAKFAKNAPAELGGGEYKAEDRAAGSANKLLDMSKNRTRRSERPSSQPGVAAQLTP